jgi:hypothetical protein
MTESQWAACSQTRSMLEFLRGRISERKLWLFAAACLRQVPPDELPEWWQACVEVEERYADGLATPAELNAAWRKRVHIEDEAIEWDVVGVAWGNALETASDAVALSRGYTEGSFRTIEAVQCDLIRDIAGNPFHQPTVDPVWLTWNDSAVRKLAQTIYDERWYDSLTVLADALGEAGCGDAAILAHCRDPGPHVRGCWVVDLLLGKE